MSTNRPYREVVRHADALQKLVKLVFLGEFERTLETRPVRVPSSSSRASQGDAWADFGREITGRARGARVYVKFHVRGPRASSRAPRAGPLISRRARAWMRPKRARVAVDYAESESDASDSESESEAVDPDKGSDDASEDDDYEDDDVEESEDDEPVEEDENADDILVTDDEDDDVTDLEEWDPESIRQHVMLEFNQAYASFGDFTSQDTRDAFRWIWNIERGGRLVPVAELVSDSTLVQEHVSALGKELESAMDGPEGDYLLKATELQERHREFLHSGIVKETRLLATDIGIRYDARKLSEHGGIPHAYRCRRVVCELFAVFLIK